MNYTRLEHECFLAWAEFHVGKKTHQGRIRQCLNMIEHRNILRGVFGWRDLIHSKKIRHKAAETAAQMLRSNQFNRHFREWRVAVIHSRQLNNQDGETSRALHLLLQRACMPVFHAWRKHTVIACRRKNFGGVHWSGVSHRPDFAQMYPNRSPDDTLKPDDSVYSNLDKLEDSVSEMETPKKILVDSGLSSLMTGDQISMRVWTRRLGSLWQHMALSLVRNSKTSEDTLHTEFSSLFIRWKACTARQAKHRQFESMILQLCSTSVKSATLHIWCHVVARIRILAGF
jgi:hypothetical protein